MTAEIVPMPQAKPPKHLWDLRKTSPLYVLKSCLICGTRKVTRTERSGGQFTASVLYFNRSNEMLASKPPCGATPE
jgi:hypothetical protein